MGVWWAASTVCFTSDAFGGQPPLYFARGADQNHAMMFEVTADLALLLILAAFVAGFVDAIAGGVA